MGTPTTHRDVIAWRQAMALVEDIHHATRRFPREEASGLAAQIRSAAFAVPARLAEGATRGSIDALVERLGMSCSCLAALDTQLEIAVRLGYLEPDARAIIATRRLGVLVSILRRSLAAETPERH